MNITLDPKQFRIEKTTRGAPCLIFENYKFRYGNKMKDEIRWRCTNKLCKATIKTNEKGITEKRTVHDHEPVGDRKATKKSSKVVSRIKVKPISYFRPQFDYNFENNESFVQPPVENIMPITRNGSSIGSVRYFKNEFPTDVENVIVVNETPAHFMDILRKYERHLFYARKMKLRTQRLANRT
ncbi:UNVERIFIED_CONTAM: hypothetical protein PYX00_002288 [Menopon gallinae]|uniref:FLYWCH-type domain-containing protein n=1 Tax=Menopon gallinae TaxID=328185 RepID=A0AAW2IGE8_9NEOP